MPRPVVPPILRFGFGLYLQLTTGPVERCLTQTSLTLPQSFHAHATAVVARYRLHSSGRISSCYPSSTRGGPGFILCCRLRLPVTSPRDLVHRRPGPKCAGGAFYAKGMHHEVVQQLCRPQIKGLAGRPSYGLLKEVDCTGKPFSRNHGERVPGDQVRSNTSCGRDVRRDRPGRTNRRAVPVC